MRIVMWAIVGLAACANGRSSGPGGGDDGGSSTAGATLSISPATIAVVVENGVAAHATFTAMLTFRDGTTKDVTGTTRFDIDPRYGAFDHNSVAIGVAVRAQVLGTYSDDMVTATASADVISRVHSVRVVAALPDTTPARFPDTATVVNAPALVYPHDDAQPTAPSVVVPRNLGDFELHWRDALGDDALEMSLSTDDGAGGKLSDVRVYVPAGNAGGTAGWAAFKPSEWKAAVGFASKITYQLRGANPATPGTVSATASYTVSLSETDVDGTVYFFSSNADGSLAGIFRHYMAAEPGIGASSFLSPAQTGNRCVGCHAVSRDGTQMAVTYQDIGMPPGQATTVDVATKTIAPSTDSWTYATFTPDNKQFLAISGGKLFVRDAKTQQKLAQMDSTGKSITQPELSPDGTKLVYVVPALPNSDSQFRGGQIFWRTYDEAHPTQFGPEHALVADGKDAFNPSWSPDAQWIAYSKNDDTMPSNSSYDDSSTQVWIMKADGTRQLQLTAANGGTMLTNTAIRWLPSATTLAAADGTHEPMFWLTFSSKRDFGVRLTNTGQSQPAKRSQLWMTPFFPDRALSGGAGVDPSATALRLPFQNVATSNQTPQWAAEQTLIQ